MSKTGPGKEIVEPFGIELAANQRVWARLPFPLLALVGGGSVVLNVVSSLATARHWFMAEEVNGDASVTPFAVIWVFAFYLLLTLVGVAAGAAIVRRNGRARKSWRRSLGGGYLFASVFAGLNNLAGTLSLAVQDGRWIL